MADPRQFPTPTPDLTAAEKVTRAKFEREMSRQKMIEAEYPGGLGLAINASSPWMPKEVHDIVDPSNASTFGFAPKNPHFIDRNTNVGGFTPKIGSRAGEVYVMIGSSTLPRAAKTLSHESYHQGVTNNTPHPTYYLGAKDPQAPYEDTPDSQASLRSLGRRMLELQPSGESDPYWGLNATTRGANELLANIKGYEGALPKGTSIMDTEVGKALFGPAKQTKAFLNDAPPQMRKDYYYNNISYPGVGLWEGQEERVNPSTKEQAKAKIAQLLTAVRSSEYPMINVRSLFGRK